MAAGNRGAESLHFFKVIIPSTLQNKKLRIPEKFVRRFGDELSSVATLNVPNGHVWRVGLRKDERKICLQDCWHDFVEYHSIGVGYFVVFKYVKNSTFDVHIFDTTTCEIDYPYGDEEMEIEEQNSVDGDEMESEKSVEILGSTNKTLYVAKTFAQNLECKPDSTKFATATHNRKNKRPTQGKESKLKKAAYEVGTHSSDSDEVNGSTKFYENELLVSLEEMGIFISEAHRYLSVEERQSLVDAVELFKPQNPTFMEILRSKQRYSRYMYMPAKFSNKHLRRGIKSIKLQDSDGKEWPVQLTWSTGCSIRRGWPAFSKDKNLNQGDICVFELIKMKGIVLKVSIYASIK